LVALSALSGLAGCASTVSQPDRINFQSALAAGDYAGAAKAASAAGQIGPDGSSKNIVWSLNAGAALFESGDDKDAVSVLDMTEKLAQVDDLDRLHAAIDYRYTTYDGVMTNVYKAMAFLGEGDRDSARVEFRRAEDRQRRAEERFQREADYAASHNTVASRPEFGQLVQQAEKTPAYVTAGASLAELARYKPFENPFATYLSGIFLVSEGDDENGLYKLKRAAEVLGAGSAAASDLAWAEHARRHPARSAQVWVVFENGQSSTFHELRLLLPMVTGQQMTLALPVLAQNPPAYRALRVTAGAATAVTQPAGSFDAVMASEFARRRSMILAESVAEIVAKNVVSAVAQKSNNRLVHFAANLVANTSSADTRSWFALPKEFQAVRVPAPADGRIALTAADGTALGDATVPAGQNCIVWVKAQRAGARPAVQVFKL
jgi:hypothetical protein